VQSASAPEANNRGFSHETVRAWPYRSNQVNLVINDGDSPCGWLEEILEEARGASTQDIEAAFRLLTTNRYNRRIRAPWTTVTIVIVLSECDR